VSTLAAVNGGKHHAARPGAGTTDAVAAAARSLSRASSVAAALRPVELRSAADADADAVDVTDDTGCGCRPRLRPAGLIARTRGLKQSAFKVKTQSVGV